VLLGFIILGLSYYLSILHFGVMRSMEKQKTKANQSKGNLVDVDVVKVVV
jgi:hypothetical protein